ncbi:MAG: hypothetical protein JGK24_23320 [Microcoleus sp. PH2017_29_MFU_D_A]|uniref:hypothetical protein n=1 Tax=unclassified Microcoleus TaxID=2642155 RepID=UPI001D9C1A58|nr:MULTISPECIES: hypothetical protein [unclassified Microcoleus]TAE71561.1 MAG: hypothetical protein EAZ86_03285 [Oscillatoriales cyanobacterium]MCC3452257.1 hypothetical protein [Microcoleus sp. PH2017_08_TRC_O_A]MCC3587078.1 hypothetical protein [Microcoleus sp. PH2017_30_WIL_O_A]MCC3606077.1 hypothetical protein [Microcoleus sp. PH2017_29_MFU_D_A]MCC3637153.1 hypothetical protein [Microcoleus sp. PH2017_37_MFU_D_B]
MSGHFLLLNLKTQELNDIKRAWTAPNVKQPQLSPVQHQNVGWNATSRNTLKQAQTEQGIKNRDGLPPHIYLDFGVNEINDSAVQYVLSNSIDNGWVTRLQKPPNMGLKEITVNARNEWNQNRKAQAFIKQLKENGATLEIYYLDGAEIK